MSMALHDWDNDGDRDMRDNFIEYHVYKDVTDEHSGSGYTPRRTGELSTFETIISLVVGLLLECAIFTGLGIDVSKVASLFVLILWIVFSVIVAVIIGVIKH